MSRKVLKRSYLDEEAAEEMEIQRKDPSGVVPWSNPNELQVKGRNTTQGPGTSGTHRMVSSARYQDASPGAESLSSLGRHHPVSTEETRPGAVVMPGIDDDGLAIEEAYDEQVTLATHEEESTINVIARAVDTEEESRMRHDLDQLRQMLDNAPTLTPVIATRRDEENQNENVHANHDDLPSSVHPKCGSKGRQWFAMSAAILLIVVAIAVTLALVLQSEPTPPGPTTLVPNTQEPATIAPTAQPPPSQDLIDLLSSASSDGGVALADTSTPQNKALTWLAGDPNIGNYTDQEKLQRYALATLYYTAEGDSWYDKHNWLSYEPVCDNWYQFDDSTINCTQDGAVSDLDLSYNNLQVSIPPEISMLSDSLDFLRFDENELEGTIPDEIGELTKLTTLSFLNNSLIGAIPSVIGLLTNLEELWLYNNELNGTVPTEIGELTKLTALALLYNRLTGSIFPTEMGLLTQLTAFSVDHNLLTGTIPPSIGTFTDLFFLDYGMNKLSGNIPTELGLLTKLTYFSLGSNGFTGTIPSELGLLTKLTYLYLSSNGFNGTIPSELGLLTKLTWLSLGRNGLTGTVPTTLASLTLLNKLFLDENDLTGSLDAFCGIGFEMFVANTCGQVQIDCQCCTHCCVLENYKCSPV